MNKEKLLKALKRLRKCLKYGDDELGDVHYSKHIKDLDVIETALKRNIELEEENEILKIIRDNFDLWIEPNYRATLQFQQNTSLTQSDYEKLIKYFGEPRDD